MAMSENLQAQSLPRIMMRLQHGLIIVFILLSLPQKRHALAPLSSTRGRTTTTMTPSLTLSSSSRGAHSRRTLLYSSRSPRERDFWEYEDDDDDDDALYQYSYEQKYVGGSQAEQELRNMPLENNSNNNFYDDDDEESEIAKLDRPRRRDGSGRRTDMYYDDEDDEPEDTVGNFWSNPKYSLDLPNPLAQQQPQQRRRSPQQRPSLARPDAPAKKRKRKTTTFRSGIPEPPPPVSDFYNRLFWYGFDPDSESAADSPADKTMFGGTKGKFNGLAYMYNGGVTMPSEARRRRPRNRLPAGDDDADDEDYFEHNDVSDGDYTKEASDAATNNDAEKDTVSFRYSGRAADVTPPLDRPWPVPSDPTSVPARPRSSRRRPRRGSPREYENNRPPPRRRDTSPVASWFRDDDEDIDRDDGEDNDFFTRGKRKRDNNDREQQLNPLEIFFGMNRENMNRQAEAYSRQMGLVDQERTPPSSRQRNRQRPRRPGYAYRYEADEKDDESDDMPPVAEFEAVIEETVVDVRAERQPTSPSTDPPPPKKRTLSMEERALAIERVPPADIPAWGPSGDLGIDARSHAISEAMLDIAEAKQKVELREAKVDKCREELSILKVDTELEKKRLRARGGDPRRIQQKLRDLDLEIDDAARAYRYAQLQLRTAQEQLSEVEARHWAILSFYDPNQAENGIDEALREFEESEPAARRYREKMLEQERKLKQEELKRESQGAEEEDSEKEGPSLF